MRDRTRLHNIRIVLHHRKGFVFLHTWSAGREVIVNPWHVAVPKQRASKYKYTTIIPSCLVERLSILSRFHVWKFTPVRR